MKPAPVDKGAQLRHIAEAIAECGRVHTTEEQDAAARALGLGDWIPDEPELPLTRAA